MTAAPASVTAPTITIGILTFRRPDEVSACLRSVADHLAALSRPLDVTVLVVDNDPTGSARDTVDGLRRELDGVTIHYVVERTPGIAAARNRALDESAETDLLVFIDDDERPTASWLEPLIAVWESTGASAVMGRVVSVFAGELDDWVAAGEFFRRRSMPTGSAVTVAAAGNLLLDRAQVAHLGVRFDETLGLGAGEDSLFSMVLVRQGGRIAWCEESVALDRVPAERMTRRWVLDRARSHGNAETVVALRLADSPSRRLRTRVRAVLRGSVRVATGHARSAAGHLSGSLRHQARGLRTAHRGRGILAGGLGTTIHEYARADDPSATDPAASPTPPSRSRTAEEHHHATP